MKIGEQRQKQRVVIEHFFKVRDGPGFVDSISAEAAAEVIENPAGCHFFQSELDLRKQVGVVGAGGFAQAKGEFGGTGKFGGAAESAVLPVDGGAEFFAGELNGLVVRGVCGMGGIVQLGEDFDDFAILLGEGFRLFFPGAGDAAQDVRKGGHSAAGGRGEISPAEKGDAVRGKKHGQRPSAGSAGEEVMRGLIDAVQVGALFAVHFDVDEEFVHHLGDFGVGEGFARHHMAPVAGGVSDGEQDRAVLAFGFGQRGGAPLAPVDRIFGVLEQIGAQRAGEEVFGGHGGPVVFQANGRMDHCADSDNEE